MREHLSRRKFLSSSAAGLGVAGLGALASPGVLRTKALGAEDKVRMGFIGVGGRGTTHLRTVLENPGAEVTWVCDIDPTRLESASRLVEDKQGKRPSATESHKRVLEAKDVDGVLIATPCDVHAALYLDAIAAGKDLYAEKPMCITVEDCDAVVKAAEGSKSIVQVGFQSRYNPRIREGIERIHKGDFGEIVEMRGTYLAHFGPLRGWFSKRDRSGDWMVEQACHFFDVMNWAFKGVALKAYGWGRKDVFTEGEPDRDVTDYYSALLEYPGGVIVSWLHSWLCPAGGNFNKHTLHFMGRKGAVDVNEGVIEWMDRSPSQKLQEPGTDATRLAHDAFLECVRTRKQPFSNVHNGRDAVMVGLLVREAVDHRRLAAMDEYLQETRRVK
jgi:predicted dehydrogenase